MFLYRPVLAGIWRQHEAWDGTYSFEDLLDAHDLLDLQSENRRRAEKATRRE